MNIKSTVILILHTILIVSESVPLNEIETNHNKQGHQDIKNIKDFINTFRAFNEKMSRKKRAAFDESVETDEHDRAVDKLVDKLPDITSETLEDNKLKLELGQKYDEEFKKLLKMDGIDLEDQIITHLNKSFAEMFRDTLKETFHKYEFKYAYPGYIIQTDWHDAVKEFQSSVKLKVTDWFERINAELPNLLIASDGDKELIKTPQGRSIYQSLVNHKCKVLRRAIRSYINHKYKRLEFEMLNTIMKPVHIRVPVSRKSCEKLNFSVELESGEPDPPTTKKVRLTTVKN